jgi:hypothetical protein
MTDFLHTLADSDGDIGKLVVGVIALIIWGVSALASSAKKRQEQQRRRQVFERIARGSAAPPTRPVPARPGMRPKPAAATTHSLPPQAARVMSPPPPGARRGKSKKQPRQSPVQPLPPPLPEPAIVAAATIAPALSLTRPAAAKAPVVDARALSRWLTPATLRSQFMLTEVLQPPLALREPRE